MTLPDPAPSPSPERAAAARALAALPAWAGLDASSLAATVVSGGITNALVRVGVAEEDKDGRAPSAVLVRTYGPKTELLINRRREVASLRALAVRGFGVAVLAEFEGGRVEQYLPARPLAPEELTAPTVAAAVARGVARLHAAAPLPPLGRCRPQLWSTVAAWIALAERVAGGQPLAVDAETLRAAAARVRRAVSRLRSPVVYCHMDLLPGNMLVPECGWVAPTEEEDAPPLSPGAGSHITLIDFEYGRPAPRGFDVGNHWCEYAGLDCEWGRYPDEAARTAWAAAYLREAARLARRPAPSPVDVAALVTEGDAYSLAAHVFWTAWACVQARVSDVDFDYVEYARSRLAEYGRRVDGVLGPLEAGGSERVGRGVCCFA